MGVPDWDAEPAEGVPAPLPPVRRLRVCLLGGTADGCSFQRGVGKLDVASALLRGLTADQPGAADPILDLAFDRGVFERAWWELLKEAPEDAPNSLDRWGAGVLGAWDAEGRLRYDRRAAGEATPPYEADPAEDCASLCAGSSEKLHFGHKRSPGILRAFRETLLTAGLDLAALEGVQKELYAESEKNPRALVRKDRPCAGLLAAFARFSPEVGDLPGCGATFLHVFEPESRPLGSSGNVAMLYAAAPTSRLHRAQSPGAFLCALRAAGSNIARLVREYNRTAAEQAASEAWERSMWWQADLRAQVEYFMSDKNMRTDTLFREKVLYAEEGWLELDGLREEPRLKAAGVTVQEELLDALKESKCVETKVGEDGKVVVRRTDNRPPPELDESRKRGYGGAQGPLPKRQRGNLPGARDDPRCWDFVRKGFCPRGDKCRYTHSLDEAGANGAASAAALAAAAEGGAPAPAVEGANGAAVPVAGEEAAAAAVPATATPPQTATATPPGPASGEVAAAATTGTSIGMAAAAAALQAAQAAVAAVPVAPACVSQAAVAAAPGGAAAPGLQAVAAAAPTPAAVAAPAASAPAAAVARAGGDGAKPKA